MIDNWIPTLQSPTKLTRDFDSLNNLGNFDAALINDLKKKIASTRRQGTRVLPVYVFSLLGKSEDLLFDEKALVRR